VNRVGYKRKKKTKETQKVQYNEDDNHHVQSRIFSHRGVVLVGHDDLISIALEIYKYIF
tara:strand:- start:229 stop:405 length:177 start_codon:yes stop_codon:yes gene_type:complete